jgi:hypothetical protein
MWADAAVTSMAAIASPAKPIAAFFNIASSLR